MLIRNTHPSRDPLDLFGAEGFKVHSDVSLHSGQQLPGGAVGGVGLLPPVALVPAWYDPLVLATIHVQVVRLGEGCLVSTHTYRCVLTNTHHIQCMQTTTHTHYHTYMGRACTHKHTSTHFVPILCQTTVCIDIVICLRHIVNHYRQQCQWYAVL